ncbi:MAG: AAA family ATPase [Flavisolibacter sp.]
MEATLERKTAVGTAANGMKTKRDKDNSISDLSDHLTEISDPLSPFAHLRITGNSDVPDLEPIILWNGEIVAAKGDLVVFSGGVKIGKSGALDPFIAAAIGEGTLIDPFDFIEVLPNSDKAAVIHIDTEQHRSKHKKKVKSILKRIGLKDCPEHFISLNVKQLNIGEHKPVTSAVCRAAEDLFGGVYLIVIDGIIDYISDPNNTEESNGIIKYCEQLAEKHNCPVLAVIHTNPNSDKERGNAGSQAIRKASSVISVKSEDDVSYLEPKYLRHAGKRSIPSIMFQFDSDKGYHVCVGMKVQERPTKRQSHSSLLTAIVDEVFAPPKSFAYGDAIAEIMRLTEKSEKTAKTRFSELKTLNLITQGTDQRWRKSL